jgi:hypothetical protein
MKSLANKISIESIILALICLADMLSTLFFVSMGYAVEQNPIMAACLRHGPGIFILAKMASFIPFIACIEIYRRHKPTFSRNAARTAIILYLAIYVILTVRTNMA